MYLTGLDGLIEIKKKKLIGLQTLHVHIPTSHFMP